MFVVHIRTRVLPCGWSWCKTTASWFTCKDKHSDNVMAHSHDSNTAVPCRGSTEHEEGEHQENLRDILFLWRLIHTAFIYCIYLWKSEGPAALIEPGAAIKKHGKSPERYMLLWYGPIVTERGKNPTKTPETLITAQNRQWMMGLVTD